MRKKMKKKFQTVLIWMIIGSMTFIGSLGLNLSNAKADVLPEISFAKISDSNWENVINPAIEITLSTISTEDVSVEYTVIGGTATIGSDYELINGKVTIPSGQYSEILPLTVTDDQIVEGNETIIINLQNPTGVTLVEPSTFTYTIMDNDTLPVTTLETTPSLPDGENGWFVTNPTIDFSVDRLATTYYKWNNDITWEKYDDIPLNTVEGNNTLYYYSVDSNTPENIEAVQAQDIKVDKEAPSAPISISATTDKDGFVQLSWSEVKDAASYEILRSSSPYVLIGTTNETTYLDTTVTENKTYSYEVVAVDEAGNRSLATVLLSPITIPKIEKPVIVPVIIEQPKVETASVITPAIASGISTYQAPQVTEEKVEEVTPAVEGASTENADETDKDQNWNRLLLAISILIIAAGAAIGGYYGYQWFLARREEEDSKDKGPKSKSRW